MLTHGGSVALGRLPVTLAKSRAGWYDRMLDVDWSNGLVEGRGRAHRSPKLLCNSVAEPYLKYCRIFRTIYIKSLPLLRPLAQPPLWSLYTD